MDDRCFARTEMLLGSEALARLLPAQWPYSGLAVSAHMLQRLLHVLELEG